MSLSIFACDLTIFLLGCLSSFQLAFASCLRIPSYLRVFLKYIFTILSISFIVFPLTHKSLICLEFICTYLWYMVGIKGHCSFISISSCSNMIHYIVYSFLTDFQCFLHGSFSGLSTGRALCEFHKVLISKSL